MSFNTATAHRSEVKFPFGELESMIEWCEKNCLAEWKFDDSDNGYTFYFGSEKDYFAFMIWKT